MLSFGETFVSLCLVEMVKVYLHPHPINLDSGDCIYVICQQLSLN